MTTLDFALIAIVSVVILNLALTLVTLSLVLKLKNNDAMTSGVETVGAAAFLKNDVTPSDNDAPLSAQEISEVYARYKVSGGYRPKDPPKSAS